MVSHYRQNTKRTEIVETTPKRFLILVQKYFGLIAEATTSMSQHQQQQHHHNIPFSSHIHQIDYFFVLFTPTIICYAGAPGSSFDARLGFNVVFNL